MKNNHNEKVGIGRFIQAIRRLPSDKPKDDPRKWYKTQKQHWLGWLGEYRSPGYYGRKPQTPRNARYAYNHIMCPEMLLYLIAAGRVKPSLVKAARHDCSRMVSLAAKCAAVRKHAPWPVVSAALWRK